MHRICVIIGVLALLQSCSYFRSTDNPDAVVQLDSYSLTQDDIKAILPEVYTPEDSTRIVQAFINQWATDRLFFERAKDNISKSDQEKLDELVEKYRIELYSQTYMQDLIVQKLDTALTSTAIQKYYENHKSEFRLNEELIKFKYVHLTPSLNNINAVERLFNSSTDQSRKELDSLSVTFKDSYLNDGVWNRKATLLERVARITPSNEQSYIIPGKYSRLEDSVGVYLVRVSDVRKRGETAPLEYIKPTVREVLINRRKLANLKKLEKQLLDDAISSDKLQIKK